MVDLTLPHDAQLQALFAKKRLLLIGTSEIRPFILEESIKTAQALDIELILLDNPEARRISRDVIPDANFIGAPIDNHDPVVVNKVIEQVTRATGGKIDAVITFLNPYAELAGRLVDTFDAAGNSGESVAAAHTKSIARDLFSKIPEIATPYRVVASVEEALKAYDELGGGKFVMKPIHGGGSALVVIDIDSAEKVAAVYTEIEEGIKDFASRPDAGIFLLDQNPGIMMERQLEGHEVDVELVLEDGKVKFWHVSDNPPTDVPYPVEKGASYPSQLPRAWTESLVNAAGLAVSALGLKTGNMHVEMMATADGPRVLEVNARMGGAFVWHLINVVTGVNLIEQGLRSVLGFSVVGVSEPKIMGDVRYLIPKATGTIEILEGLDEVIEQRSINRVVRFKSAGENVQILPDDFFGWVAATGETFAEAEDSVLAALSTINIAIRQGDGVLIEQTGANAQQKISVLDLLPVHVRQGPPECSPAIKAYAL
ncbi:ATP-grasp domain-containing protein [Pseudomonas syringae]|uniref:ATP-grasp domain-containing protein n=1 Tax=Pseudomonas syringae TaxID=317 RepID=UPI0002A7AFFF|nr:ATP-grasp domain-containing protein [Pseudomonas syringae]ELP95903.1 hypothetical protein A987_25137 [Pseudomonas syringae BRIP34881]ELP96270.1 hypothetical protein A979_23207 [Pseudomonas syringae BRIP34876]